MIERTRSPLETRRPPPPESPPPLPDTPFVGLVPFDVGDAPFFFGRERERRLIAANLMASRLTLLYGPSGVGKSSVLRAGVEYDLRERARRELARNRMPEWIPVVFSSWSDDPIPALRDAIAATLAETFRDLAPDSPPAGPLDELLAAWVERLDELVGPDDDDRRVRLLIVLDQFEEYFLYHGDEKGEGTLAVELPRAVNREGLRANFAISIREDAYAQLDRFKGRIPNLFESYFRIRQLERAAAERVVTEPIEVYNKRLPANEKPFKIEPELVKAVLDEVKTGTVVLGQVGEGTVGETTDARIEAPFLQLVMRRLWNDARSRGDRKLSLARLQELGGANSIVGAHLYEAMEQLDPAQRDIAARVFRQLVTPSGTKIAHTLADLADFADVTPEQLRPMLLKLSDSRILRPVDPPPGETAPRYEIFHDVLAAAVLDWHAAYVREREEADRRRADRRRLRARLITALGGTLAVGIVAVAIFAIWAVWERNRAESAADNAQSLSLARESDAQRDSSLDVALLLGLEAYRASARPEARSSVMSALAAVRSSGVTAILRGHTTAAPSVAFSPEGRTLAFAGADGTVRLWDLRTRKLKAALRGHTGRVRGVAFSPDGDSLASAGEDGRVRLWDVARRKPLGPPVIDGAGQITSMAFNGRLLAFADFDLAVRLWDVGARRLVGRLTGHTDHVLGIAFSPDGRTLASAGRDETVRLWDVQARRQVGLLVRGRKVGRRVEDNDVTSVAFSPDGRLLASGDADDGSVQLWDVGRRKKLGTPVGAGKGPVLSVAFSADGRTLAFAGEGQTVWLWDVRTRKQLDSALVGHTNSVDSVAFSPDGRSIASGSEDGTVRLWDAQGPKELGVPLLGHVGFVSSVAFSPDEDLLVSAGDDGTVRLWDVQGGTPRGPPLRVAPGAVYSVAFSPDGSSLALGSKDGTVRILEDVGARPLRKPPLSGHTAAVYSVAFSPDGGSLASASEDGTVRLWSVRGGTPLGRPLHRGSRPVYSVTFSPDGELLASGGEDGIVRLWDVGDRVQVAALRGHDGFISSVLFTADGDTLASGGADGRIRLWDVRERNTLVMAIQGNAGFVLSLASSPNEATLAVGGGDGAVQLLDLDEGIPLGEALVGHTGQVQSVAFSPDGRTLVSGGFEGTVRLWEGIFWRDFADLREQVCGLVVGNLTQIEWHRVTLERDYRPVCAP